MMAPPRAKLGRVGIRDQEEPAVDCEMAHSVSKLE